VQQSRAYQPTSQRGRPPAAAAVAREEEEDDAPAQSRQQPTLSAWIDYGATQRPYARQTPASAPRPPLSNLLAESRPTPTSSNQIPLEDQPDWQCDTCSHVNLPIRDHCLMCKSRKPLNPKLITPEFAYGSSLTALGQRGFEESSPRQPRDWESRTGSRFDNAYSQDRPRDSRARQPLVADRYDRSETARRLETTNRARSGEGRREGEVPWVKKRPGEWPFRPPEDSQGQSFRIRRLDAAPTPQDRLPPASTRPGTDVRLPYEERPPRQGSSFGDFVARQQSRLDQRPSEQALPQNNGVGGFRLRPRSSGKSGLEELLEAVTPKGEPLWSGKAGKALDNNFDRDRKPRGRDAWSTRRSEHGGLNSPEQATEDISEVVVPLTSLEDLDRKGNPRLDAKLGRRSQRFEIEDPDEPQLPEYMRRNEKIRSKGRRQGNFVEQEEYTIRGDENELMNRPEKRKKAKDKKSTHGIDGKLRIYLPEFISVENLAKVLGIRFQDFVTQLEGMGFEEVRNDHILDAETSGLIASEFNFEPIFSSSSTAKDLVARPILEDKSHLPRRPPIVTIMGHVDHGKTTILDWLRKTSVVLSEHGGITQHIGAFAVTLPGTNERITFLDTPGHSAFLDMRRRGANVTDIVILVVAADDSVKPQTLEAIKHAMDAKVDIIVAINKIDKEDANVERVKQDLARHGLSVEDYGGNYQAIPVSGKTGKGMQELEEATVLLASVHDYRAETDGPAEGWIIESKVTTAGRVATILVRRGTMRPGDFIVAGTTWARIRTLRDDTGQLIDQALPGTPVQIDGWRGEDPSAGLEVLQAENEEQAKSVVDFRQDIAETARLTTDTAAINAIRSEEAESRAKVLEWEAQQEWAKKRVQQRPKDNEGWVEESANSANAGGKRLVHFVIKGDVAGSVEALVGAVSAVGNNEIGANIIRSGVGLVAESDVQHLAATGETGFIISFNQPPVESSAGRMAEAAGLKILDHNIIYKVTDDVKERLEALLPPLVTQRVLGEAEVGKIFEISVKSGKLKIAGCKISNGTIARDKKVRVLRRGEEIFSGMFTMQYLFGRQVC
jgi:small GTP-binding protein